MKNLKYIYLFLILVSITTAQPILTEKANPATASDLKLNSDTVPNVYAINGQFERIVVLRFKNQADLLTELEDIVKAQKINNAVIISGIGSVTDYHIHTVSNRTFPTKNIFLKDTTSSADIANMNGYIINGRVHVHITLTYADKAFGGHLEKGTKVFTFAIVTIGVLKEGIDLNSIDDKNYR